MNADELFQSTGDAYLALIHLENHVGDAVQKISRACANCPRDLIDQLLLDSPSWRGRNLGLAMATIRGLDQHYNSLIAALIKSGGMSIVPLAAGISVAVRDCGCTYSPNMTEALNRTAWDGEIGFALDWLHFTIGLAGAVKPEFADGPNYGQAFITHLEFYTELNRA